MKTKPKPKPAERHFVGAHIDRETKTRIERAARINKRSLSAQIAFLLEAGVGLQ